MLKLQGNDIYRGPDKIGWLQENHIFDRTGKKIGYFEQNYVYDADARKLAYVEEDFLMPYGGAASAKVRLEQIAEDVTGGVVPEIARAAIYILLGS